MHFLNEPKKYDIRTSGSPEQLNELLVRLMFRMYPMRPGGGDIEIVAGGAPREVLDRVPVPEGSRIIGSSVSKDNIIIVLDSPLNSDALREFYLDSLTKAGWSKPDSPLGMRQGGFEHQLMEQVMGLTFCGGENGPALTVNMHDRTEGETHLFLSYQTNTENTLCGKKMQRQRMMMPNSKLPKLSAMRGDTQMPAQSGMSNSHEASHARLTSNKPLAEVASHYQEQLARAGWTLKASKVEESSVQSLYDFKDEDGNEWGAFFSVLARPGVAGSYYMMLDAEEKIGGRGGTVVRAGFSFS